MIDALDVTAISRWTQAAARSLEAHRSEIDDINVYPVADNDTGTNLAVTVRAGAEHLAAAVAPAMLAPDGRTVPAAEAGASRAADAGAALAAFARGSVLGARGNSGVILSQFLRGLADSADRLLHCDATALATGLRRGAVQARAAVTVPVAGTILDVAEAAADAAFGHVDLGALVRAVVAAAEEAVRRTPERLPELARAGVVDAGGQGLALLLVSLAEVVTGEISERRPRLRVARSPGDLLTAREAGSADYAFEVQFLLDAGADAVARLREELVVLGDCVAVVGTGDGVWNVHAHVNDVGAAIEAGVEAGRPHRITVVGFGEQGDAHRSDPVCDPASARGALGAEEQPGDPPLAVVAVAPGEGLVHLFRAEGVRVVDGSASRPPTVAQVHRAMRSTPSTEVVLLPNASQITGVAEAAAELARADGVRVAVVPTRSPVQGLAAVAVLDTTRRFEDNVVAMAEAAAATRFAEITLAESEALTSVGTCRPGDVLGLIDGEVVEIGRGLVAVALALVDRILGVGPELLTVLVGSGEVAGLGDLLAAHVRAEAPLTEVRVFAGGQPDHPLIIGVE